MRKQMKTVTLWWRLGLKELRPVFLRRDLNTANILIQVKDELQGISWPEVRKRSLGTLQSDTRLNLPTGGSNTLGGARHGKPLLQNFIGSKSKAELRRWAKDTSRPALEEGPETFILPDGRCTVAQPSVPDITFPGFDLQTRLDNITGCCHVGSRHTGNGTSRKELHNTKPFGGAFTEHFGFQVRVRGEIDCGEGDWGAGMLVYSQATDSLLQ